MHADGELYPETSLGLSIPPELMEKKEKRAGPVHSGEGREHPRVRVVGSGKSKRQCGGNERKGGRYRYRLVDCI